jgi:hypothetical protein
VAAPSSYAKIITPQSMQAQSMKNFKKKPDEVVKIKRNEIKENIK